MFWFLKKKVYKEWLGCRPEPPDTRDYHLEEILKVPIFFDWKKGFDIEEELGIEIKPIKNQGKSSSCVGQAWSYYASVLEAREIKIYRETSARWIYNRIYLKNGGAYLREGGQVLTNIGIVPIVLYPDYKTEEEMRKREDTKDLFAVAKVYLKDNYFSFSNDYNIDSFASILRNHYGFVGGVFDGFDSSWLTPFPKPSGSRITLLGHALYFGKAKLIKGKKYLGAVNSWGEKIGDKGWQWFGEEWFESKRIFFPKVIKDLPSEVERPKEKPKHYFKKDLYWGMRDPEVRILQKCLAYENLFLYPTFTDYFGGYTLRAVKAFQAKYGITPISGFVGAKTRKKLNEIFS